jgi:ATP-dependent helicase HrpA
MGRGRERGLIGVTQPRRIAATSVAARVASELKARRWAATWATRCASTTAPARTLREVHDRRHPPRRDPGRSLLRRYDTLIIDEAHERSLNIDFLLGWIARILPSAPISR